MNWCLIGIRSGEEDAFRRVPDASYASNIAMQAWNIGRTLERSFIYAATRSWIVAKIGAGAYMNVDTRARALRIARVMNSLMLPLYAVESA